MLSFFTNPYPDELLYSAIARYHFYSGNLDCKDTLEEVFQIRTVIPSVEIGSHFKSLAKQMGTHYSVEILVSKYTIYPFMLRFYQGRNNKGSCRMFKEMEKDYTHGWE